MLREIICCIGQTAADEWLLPQTYKTAWATLSERITLTKTPSFSFWNSNNTSAGDLT